MFQPIMLSAPEPPMASSGNGGIRTCDVLIAVGIVALLLMFVAFLRPSPPQNQRTCSRESRVVRIQDPDFSEYYTPSFGGSPPVAPPGRSKAYTDAVKKYANLAKPALYESIPNHSNSSMANSDEHTTDSRPDGTVSRGLLARKP